MILNKNNYISTQWLNGKGTTKQLFIYPHHAQLKLQNFKLRISIATLTTAPTPFSRFQLHQRYLALLNGGPLQLFNKHNDQVIVMHPIKQILNFGGEQSWQCESLSEGRDFNFFVQKGLDTKMSIEVVAEVKILELNVGTNMFYNSGEVQCQVKWNNKIYVIKGEELLVLAVHEKSQLSARGEGAMIFWCWASEKQHCDYLKN